MMTGNTHRMMAQWEGFTNRTNKLINSGIWYRYKKINDYNVQKERAELGGKTKSCM